MVLIEIHVGGKLTHHLIGAREHAQREKIRVLKNCRSTVAAARALDDVVRVAAHAEDSGGSRYAAEKLHSA